MFTKQTIAKRGKLNEDFRAVFSIAPHHNSDKVDLARAAFRFSSKVEHFNNCPFRTKNKNKKSYSMEQYFRFSGYSLQLLWLEIVKYAETRQFPLKKAFLLYPPKLILSAAIPQLEYLV